MLIILGGIIGIISKVFEDMIYNNYYIISNNFFIYKNFYR
jgi:hypothetical protein